MLSASRAGAIGGRVQGVGFRPFVYRLAHLYELTGWVRNRGGEVEIHAEGPPERLQLFAAGLSSQAPPAAAAACLLDVRRGARASAATAFEFCPSTSGEELHVHVPLGSVHLR